MKPWTGFIGEIRTGRAECSQKWGKPVNWSVHKNEEKWLDGTFTEMRRINIYESSAKNMLWMSWKNTMEVCFQPVIGIGAVFTEMRRTGSKWSVHKIEEKLFKEQGGETMKKILLVMLAMVMVFSMSACGIFKIRMAAWFACIMRPERSTATRPSAI